MSYTAVQASRLTGCSVSQVRYWSSVGLVRPDASTPAPYTFRHLVALRLVRSLLDAGLPLQRIRKAVAYLQSTGEDLAGLRLVTDGSAVVACRSDGEVLDALAGGQLALFVPVGPVAREVEAEIARFDGDRRAFVEALRGDDASAQTGDG